MSATELGKPPPSADPNTPTQDPPEAQKTPPPEGVGEKQPKPGEGEPPPADSLGGGKEEPGAGEKLGGESAPQAYEAFTAPEGVVLDPNVSKTFEATARDLNLTQEGAQKLIDAVLPAMAQQEAEATQQNRVAWMEASRNDPDFGGTAYDANLAIAARVYDNATLVSPELRELLHVTGLNTHPEVLRHFWQVGRAISPDNRFLGGDAPGEKGLDPKNPQDAAKILYAKDGK